MMAIFIILLIKLLFFVNTNVIQQENRENQRKT